MTTKYKIFKDKESWLKMRTKYITSTEVASLFGCERSGQYGKSYFELWHDKKNPVEEFDAGGNDSLKGLYFEPAIAQWFSDIHGLSIKPFKSFAYDDKLKQGSSFDYQAESGEVEGVDVTGAIIEIKTAKYSIYKEKWIDDMPPAYIEFQVQAQMKLTGIDKAIIVLFVDGDYAPRHWIIEACKDTHKAIDIKCKEFWDSIENNVEPEPDFDKDARFVLDMNQISNGDNMPASDEMIDLLEKYHDMNQETKAIDKKMLSLKAEILSKTQAEGLYWDGYRASLKTNKKGVRSLSVKEMD